MKKEREQKNRLLQRILQGIRKTAIDGAGRPSHKGLFEPEVPESAKKSGGGAKNEIIESRVQIYADSSGTRNTFKNFDGGGGIFHLPVCFFVKKSILTMKLFCADDGI